MAFLLAFTELNDGNKFNYLINDALILIEEMGSHRRLIEEQSFYNIPVILPLPMRLAFCDRFFFFMGFDISL